MRQIDDGRHIKIDIITAVSFHFLLNLTKIHATTWPILYFSGFDMRHGFNNSNSLTQLYYIR